MIHEREMHLIFVRRDLASFRHLHPSVNRGTWSVAVKPDLEPGVWRAFADFSTGGTPYTLGVDLHVAGNYVPEPLPSPSTTSMANPFSVHLRERHGSTSFNVERDGAEVALDAYLGARGHLVVVREGDLAFLHVHPVSDDLEFAVTYPSRGGYRLFLQFSVEDTVHLAAFTRQAFG